MALCFQTVSSYQKNAKFIESLKTVKAVRQKCSHTLQGKHWQWKIQKRKRKPKHQSASEVAAVAFGKLTTVPKVDKQKKCLVLTSFLDPGWRKKDIQSTHFHALQLTHFWLKMQKLQSMQKCIWQLAVLFFMQLCGLWIQEAIQWGRNAQTVEHLQANLLCQWALLWSHPLKNEVWWSHKQRDEMSIPNSSVLL